MSTGCVQTITRRRNRKKGVRTDEDGFRRIESEAKEHHHEEDE
jgi:hypothetical protein